MEDKLEALFREKADLDKKIENFQKKGITTDLQAEIKALHDYNEMKDLAQMVLGYLANIEQVSVAELHARYNLPLE